MLDLIDREDLARELGVSPHSINRLVKAKKLPAPIRLGWKTVRWSLESVKAHLTALTLV